MVGVFDAGGGVGAVCVWGDDGGGVLSGGSSGTVSGAFYYGWGVCGVWDCHDDDVVGRADVVEEDGEESGVLR